MRGYQAYKDVWRPIVSNKSLFVSEKKQMNMTGMLFLYV